MSAAPIPRPTGRSWALWERLARGRIDFGNPDVFFGAARIPNSLWVTFTVTDTGSEFVNKIAALTDSKAGRGGLVTLKDSGWVISLSVFHQPEMLGQPAGTSVWWGYGLYPDRTGAFVKKPMTACTGAEILEETYGNCASIAAGRDHGDFDLRALLHALRQQRLAPGSRGDMPPPVPEGATNSGDRPVRRHAERNSLHHRVLGALGVGGDPSCSSGPAPPLVYQGQFDPKALFGALKVFLSSPL